MKSTDDLFLLIQSLSKTEKRYFKIFTGNASEKDGNNYQKLFDLINNQTEYDEEKLVNSFYEGKNSKHFPSTKRRLYQLILKSLNNYYSTISKETELYDSLNEARILYKKGLYKQSNKILEKLIVFAEHYELFSGLINICELKYELISHTTKSHAEMYSEFSKIRALLNQALEALDIEQNYQELYACFIEKLRLEGDLLRKQSQVDSFNELMLNPYLQDGKQNRSVKCKTIYYFIQSIYYYILCEHDQAIDYSLKGIEYLEKQNQIKPIESSICSARISNMCEIYLRAKNYRQFEVYLTKLTKCAIQFSMEENKLFYSYNDLLFRSYIKRGEFQKAIDLFHKFEAEMAVLSDTIPHSRMIRLYYYLACAFFASKNYKNALIEVNRLLEEKSNYRIDILCHSRILNCILQLEIGDYNSQESALRSTSYYLKKHDYLFEFETLFLRFYTKFIRESEWDKQKNLLENFKNELIILFENPIDSVINDYFDIISWLESKLNNLNFQDIVKSKNDVKAII